MYRCTDCGMEFEFAEIFFETHGLSTPPYERIKRGPHCHSAKFLESESLHCNFCGAKLTKEGKYCSERCRKAGEIYYAEQEKRRAIFIGSPVAAAVREVEEYNKKHGTKYSYGQYFMLKDSGGL